ncbi:hypothetical protein DMA11_07990 [Marinilabiliaceae bacterium JC017]|nr:hypothetical protein DMA11_07990 [Marinilabiliaceae bacterium JC017]
MLQYQRFLLVSLFVLVTNVFLSDGQCISFAKNVCKSELGKFVHDGNYNATILSEGETAEVYKTFFDGQAYRIAVCKVEGLPRILFKVIDSEGEVLFDNSEHDYTTTWDFGVETTQLLTIQLNVLEKDEESLEKEAGCVAILFGIRAESENRKRR